ncbi:MAG: hypothetical protein FWD60_09285 [Candidatus Azobacteroides sp.]|nr:hypothetical protein [Candidatus Azobacteroides sp.]
METEREYIKRCIKEGINENKKSNSLFNDIVLCGAQEGYYKAKGREKAFDENHFWEFQELFDEVKEENNIIDLI